MTVTTMKQRVIACGGALLLLVVGCQDNDDLGGSASQQENVDTEILCGRLIDGLSDRPLINQRIAIQSGRIVSVADASLPSQVDSADDVVDLSDMTCLPGLINTHVHFDGNPEDSVDYSVYARRTSEQTLQLILDNARTTLLTGFTTVRHVGAWFPDAVYRARELIMQGHAMGPRIHTAGPYLTIPGGGGDLTFPEIPPEQIPAESQQGIAASPEAFAERAETAIRNGADFLKVIASGAVFSVGTEPGAPEMTQADIEAVVAVAKAHGKKVTAHVHSDQSGQDAILAGVDSLEHASLLSDSTIDLAAERGVALSMDVYNGTYTDTQRKVFEKAYEKGVTLLYGTDAAVLPHHMGGWQFAIMVERGMSPMDALQSATSVAAEHMGLSQDVGALAPGRIADLIAVEGNPLDNLDLLRDVPLVMQQGKIIKSDAGLNR